MAIPMVGGKCGCTYCKSGSLNTARGFWRSTKNKKGRFMGKFKRGKGANTGN